MDVHAISDCVVMSLKALVRVSKKKVVSVRAEIPREMERTEFPEPVPCQLDRSKKL